MAATFSDGFFQPPVNVEKGLHIHQTAIDSRLIGYDDGGEPGSGKTSKGREASRYELEFLPVLDVSGRVSVDDTVTIQEYNFL